LAKPNEAALRRQLNAIKREQFLWMLDVTKCAPQQAIMQLGTAFQNFFAGRAKYPRFHKKGRNDSFALDNGQFALDGSRIRLPHLGWVRIRETLRFTGKIVSATISRTADRWFVAVVVDTDQTLTRPAENQDKSALRGGLVVVADRWYPSTKTCSQCDHKIDSLPLSLRHWVCPACGVRHDRDLNAAINLANYAASSAVSACGEEGSGAGRKVRVKPTSVKQELSAKLAA
jgi:transposase